MATEALLQGEHELELKICTGLSDCVTFNLKRSSRLLYENVIKYNNELFVSSIFGTKYKKLLIKTCSISVLSGYICTVHYKW